MKYREKTEWRIDSLCFPLNYFYRELKFGIPIMDEQGNRLGESKKAAQKAIVQVVISRIGMAAPAMGMLLLPWQIFEFQWIFPLHPSFFKWEILNQN